MQKNCDVKGKQQSTLFAFTRFYNCLFLLFLKRPREPVSALSAHQTRCPTTTKAFPAPRQHARFPGERSRRNTPVPGPSTIPREEPLTQPPGPPLPEALSTARPRPRPVASGLAQRLPPSGQERSSPGGGASAALSLRCPGWAFRGPAPGVARRRLEPGPRRLPPSPPHLLQLPRRAGAGHIGVRVRELSILHVDLQPPRLQRHLAAAVPESGVGAGRRAGTDPLSAHQWGERAAVTSRAVRVGSAGGRAGGRAGRGSGGAAILSACRRVALAGQGAFETSRRV